MAQTLSPSDAPAWYDIIGRFDADYKSFYDNYNGLMAQGPYIQNNHPELLDSYNQSLQQGSDIAFKLEQIKPTIEYARSWLQWLQTGADNVMATAQAAYDYAKRAMGLGELGIAQVIVIVGIGAIAALLFEAERLVARWAQDAQRLTQLQTLEAQGHTPQDAASIVNQTLGPPASNEFLGIPWTLLIWGTLAVFLGPPILRMIGERRNAH